LATISTTGWAFNSSAGHSTVPSNARTHGRNETGSETGIGDVSLLGTLTPYQKLTDNFAFNWNFLGGVKSATGQYDRISEEFK